MKILITGANGMVAHAVIGHCRDLDDEVHAWTRSELDIADSAACQQKITDLSPDAVINCAAYTDVDGAESNAELAYAANAFGPENLALACKQAGAHFVTISTDYVFDGSNLGFYLESDEPHPLSVYGESKVDGERRTIRANPAAAVVRSGWIYGDGGTNFLSVMHRLLADGKCIKAICDAYGTPTFAGDLAVRLRELAASKESGIFHVANSGEGTSYLGFAEKVCEIGGFDRGLLESVSHHDLKRPAPRPVSSKLASARLAPLPECTDAMSRFLKRKTQEQKY
jgi:dTDP-4-dehydrorhamnose reductase